MATKITTRVLADNAVTDAKIADVTLTTSTQTASDNTTKIATTAYVTTAIANLADSAPSTLNTLNELAAALGDDANYATTTTNAIAAKLPLAGGAITGSIIFDNNVQAIKIKDAAGTAGYAFYLDNADTLVIGNGTTVEKIRLDTSGHEGAITIDTDGNIGIGEASPARRFVIKGDNGTTNSIQFQTPATGAASGDGFGVGYDSNGKGFIWNYEGNDTYIGGAGGTSITIQNGGNIGIGATPESTIKLDVVSGAITTPARFRFADDNNGASNNILAHEYFAGIEIENVYSGAAPSANGTKIAKITLTTVTAGGYGAGAAIHTEATSNSYDAGELVFSTGNNSSGNATERMRINRGGKVGIGIDSPAALLHVFGTENGEGASVGQLRVQSSTAYGSNPKAGIVFTNIHSAGSQAIMGGIYVGKDTTADGNYAGHMAFSTRAHGAVSVERMRINSSGTVSFGPDAQDIQIFPASINSGINKIYFRGNASNDKAEISLNHYGHHNYHIGAGLVGNALFNIGTAPTTPSFVMDTSGNVGIGHVPAGYATSGYKLRLDGGSQTYLSWNNDTHTTQVVGGFHIGTDSAAARIIQRENQPIIFSTNDTNRMEITGSGVVSAPIASTHGGSVTSGGIANPPASYLGSNGSDYGTTAIFRTPTIESTASSTTTSQFLTIYSSGHWAEYPCFRFKVYGTYYVAGYREYLGFLTSTSASLVEVQTNGTTSFFGGGGNNTITMGAAVGSGLASHGGQARYRRDFSLTTHGNYGRCYVVVEIMFGGNRYFGSNTTTANLDADGATGGSYHFKTMSAAQGQGVFSST